MSFLFFSKEQSRNVNWICVEGIISFVCYIHIIPGTKYPKLLVDNNEYTIYSRCDKRTRWRCTNYFKTKCGSTLVTFGKVVQINRSHNHPNPEKNNFTTAQKQLVTIIRNKNPKDKGN
ncbi:hypothetical protein JTB14_000795 [Gonioctena quinquepunctata]|nr:hypothetical protein JTB14_000795 [Gonioctena quinquepunctata]